VPRRSVADRNGRIHAGGRAPQFPLARRLCWRPPREARSSTMATVMCALGLCKHAGRVVGDLLGYFALITVVKAKSSRVNLASPPTRARVSPLPFRAWRP